MLICILILFLTMFFYPNTYWSFGSLGVVLQNHRFDLMMLAGVGSLLMQAGYLLFVLALGISFESGNPMQQCFCALSDKRQD